MPIGDHHAPTRRPQRSNNNKHSGGFPHSDIHGSKPVPGSPWLNAGYHVLHRLLLPRHPPNALFALDLIRKEQGWRLPSRRVLPVSKAVLSHRVPGFHPSTPVSVLDLEQHRPCHQRQMTPHSGPPAMLMLFLSQRCQLPSHLAIRRADTACSACRCDRAPMIEPV
jgi:hypothetical protein